MKRILPFYLVLAFCPMFVRAEAPSKPTVFSGNWVLETSQTKNLPEGLESYSMVVNQDAQQIQVETSLKGDLRPQIVRAPNLPVVVTPAGRQVVTPAAHRAATPAAHPAGAAVAWECLAVSASAYPVAE